MLRLEPSTSKYQATRSFRWREVPVHWPCRLLLSITAICVVQSCCLTKLWRHCHWCLESVSRIRETDASRRGKKSAADGGIRNIEDLWNCVRSDRQNESWSTRKIKNSMENEIKSQKGERKSFTRLLLRKEGTSLVELVPSFLLLHGRRGSLGNRMVVLQLAGCSNCWQGSLRFIQSLVNRMKTNNTKLNMCLLITLVTSPEWVSIGYATWPSEDRQQ